MLADTDPDVRESAARQWCAWEDAHVSLAPGHRPNPRFGEDQLILNAARLGAIPGVLIHGRFDVSGPLDTAWRLHQRWPGSELHVIDDRGHGGGDSFTTLVTTSVSILGAGPR